MGPLDILTSIERPPRRWTWLSLHSHPSKLTTSKSVVRTTAPTTSRRSHVGLNPHISIICHKPRGRTASTPRPTAGPYHLSKDHGSKSLTIQVPKPGERHKQTP